MGNESEKREKRNIKITHAIELLIWLIIILIIVAASSLTFMNKELHSENDYQIFLPDVDGLIVGSPVRMMGIEVGHVTKIKPMKDEVFVKFILTHSDVYIPQGTVVTVEFSGMAGSKSLELYLPDKNTYIDNTVPMITVNPPRRLNYALGLLNDMYKKLTSIIYTSSSFGDKMNEVKVKKEDAERAENFVQEAGKFLKDIEVETSGAK